MIGLVPFFAIITMVRPGMHWFSRVFLGGVISFLGMALLTWVSHAERNGWILGWYAIALIILSVICGAILVVRELLKSASANNRSTTTKFRS